MGFPAVPKKSNKEGQFSTILSTKESVGSQSELLLINSQPLVAEKFIPNSTSLLETLQDTTSTSSAPKIEEELSTDTTAKKSTNARDTKSCMRVSRDLPRDISTYSTGLLSKTGSYCKKFYSQITKELVKLPVFSSKFENSTEKFSMSPPSTALDTVESSMPVYNVVTHSTVQQKPVPLWILSTKKIYFQE